MKLKELPNVRTNTPGPIKSNSVVIKVSYTVRTEQEHIVRLNKCYDFVKKPPVISNSSDFVMSGSAEINAHVPKCLTMLVSGAP